MSAFGLNPRASRQRDFPISTNIDTLPEVAPATPGAETGPGRRGQFP